MPLAFLDDADAEADSSDVEEAGPAPPWPGGLVCRDTCAGESVNALCNDWLPRIAAGDQAAFAALYRATIGRMWALALKVVVHPQAAEDVLAEVYLQVWRSAASHAPSRGSPLAWMAMMCRSRAIDHLRTCDRARSSDMIDVLVEQATVDDAHPAAATVYEQSASSDHLHAALGSLPALQRQLVSLAYFRGLSHSELAAHFELPLGTVKGHMRQALARLKAFLAPESA